MVLNQLRAYILGNWLRERKRSLPNEVTLNGDVKKCGIELQEAEKCSCRALVCDGQQACEHATGIMGGFRYVIDCKLTKPWDQIDTQAATFGRPGDDCTCMGRAMLA
jgi:hypothetical protein